MTYVIIYSFSLELIYGLLVNIFPTDKSKPSRSAGFWVFLESGGDQSFARGVLGTDVGSDVCLYMWAEGCLEEWGIKHLAEKFGKVHAAVS